jgi:metallophosphoesterase superfamily enzyme
VAGQIKMILNTSTGGTNNVVITPASASLAGGTTITLNAPGESVVCIFKASKWYVIGGNGYAVA